MKAKDAVDLLNKLLNEHPDLSVVGVINALVTDGRVAAGYDDDKNLTELVVLE